MTVMPERALSLWQPWATLTAIGVKRIETRSWATKYRGPLAIHAAATTKGFDTLSGDCEGNTEAGWRYGFIGRYQAAYCYRSSDEGQRGDTFLHDEDDIAPGPCPLGAVVAACTLVDCVPMVGSDGCKNATKHMCIVNQSMLLHSPLTEPWPDGETEHNVSDQEPYGDFQPGRWAWLLADVVALDVPIPMRGWQGLWRTPAEAVAS